MRPHVAAVYAFARTGRRLRRRRATATRRPCGTRGSTTGWRGCARPRVPSAASRRPRRRARASTPARSSRRSAHTDPALRRCRSRCFEDLLSAFRQDTTVRALRHLGRRARLLPAFGQPGGTTRARYRRIARRRARRGVGRAVHGAAAHQLLAGSRGGLALAAACTCRAEECDARRRRGCGPRRAQHHPAWRAALASAAARPVSCSSAGAPVCDGVGPPALRTATHVARRHARCSTGWRPVASTCSQAPVARGRRCAAPRVGTDQVGVTVGGRAPMTQADGDGGCRMTNDGARPRGSRESPAWRRPDRSGHRCL